MKWVILGIFAVLMLTACQQNEVNISITRNVTTIKNIVNSPIDNITQNTALLNKTAENISISFIDVGPGDAIFIITPNKKFIVIDGGDGTHALKFTKYLLSRGVSEIDSVILTNPKAEHVSGINSLFTNFRIDKFFYSGAPYQATSYKNLIYRVSVIDENIAKYLVKTEIPLEIDGVNITLYPPYNGNFSNNVDENSIIIKVEYGKFSALLLSDCSGNCEYKVIDENLKSDIVKIPYHGDVEFSAKLLEATEPKITVVSNGDIPANNILLSLFTTTTYSTYEFGTLTFVSNGEKYWVKKEKIQ